MADCPLWQKGSKKKKSSRYDDSDDKRKKSSKSSSKSSSRKKSSSGRARAVIAKEMDSEEESDQEEAEKFEESDSGVASLALATEFINKSIFNLEDNGDSTNNEDCADDCTPTYCFMARGAKVTSREAYFDTSSDDDSKCEANPSYKKLAKIATEQQTAMEKMEKLLDKSDDLLDEEMDHSQAL
nr:uncharacterized protein LOC120975855 [Aegilops tauschii subsp. strangulata]